MQELFWIGYISSFIHPGEKGKKGKESGGRCECVGGEAVPSWHASTRLANNGSGQSGGVGLHLHKPRWVRHQVGAHFDIR